MSPRPPPHPPWPRAALPRPPSPTKPGCHRASGRGFLAQLQHRCGCGSEDGSARVHRLLQHQPGSFCRSQGCSEERVCRPGALRVGEMKLFILPASDRLVSPRLGTDCHASAWVWLGPTVFVPSHWFYLVMKCFLGKEGAAEAKRARPGAGAAQRAGGKRLALLGEGRSSQTHPRHKAVPG